jgi:hypothetical protein
MTVDGRRNALLALHFHEGDAADSAAHVAGCAECRAYLETLASIEAAFVSADEAPPAGLRAQVLARAAHTPQIEPRRRPQVSGGPSPLPLVGVPAAIATFAGGVWWLGERLSEWSLWDTLAPLAPGVEALAPFIAAGLALIVAGGLLSLALAPALVLERQGT